jgi:predicted lipoprotein with Yx(FWY)xxD motif
VRIAAAVLALVCVAVHAESGVGTDAPHEVALKPTGAGWMFTDRAGMTLYVSDRDITPGKSECNAGCAVGWPPLLAQPEAAPHGKWSLVRRADGTQQWAYDAKPLYRYAKDAYPGARFGERPENEVWHVAGVAIDLPPVATITAWMGGKVLTTPTGKMLYTLDTDRLPGSNALHAVALRGTGSTARTLSLSSGCSGSCLEQWQPLEAGLIALPMGEWGIAVRDDGTHQWTFRGRPLYSFSDEAAKTASADGREGVWHLAVLESAPPVPGWVRLQPTDGGIVAADPQGMTLYAYEAEMNVNRPSGGASERGCNQYCLDLYRPVLAAEDAERVGDWSLVPAPGGRRQWAYKGLPLSTFAEDRRPGDIVGTKPYRVWHTISPSGIPMQGAGGG